MNILCPVKVCIHGPINNIFQLNKYVAKSGQFFGEDKSGPASDYNPEWPSNQTLYQYKGWGKHQGIDIPVSTGTVVYSATDGIIDRVSDDISQGIGVVIWDKKQLVKTVYWHLLSHNVKVGDEVKMGQEIGISDNTGYSGGSHLHFELKTTTNTGSSEKAIDPMPYFIFNMNTERLVRAKKDVYRLARGEKDLFLNGESFQALDGRWDSIVTITQTELDAIPDGFVLIAVKSE
jgi:hypothetical protein